MNHQELPAPSAIIFDMDGVVIDSEKHWLVHGRELVARWVEDWSDEDQARVAGLGAEPLFDFLCKEYGLKASEELFVKDYHESIREVYTEHAQLIDGVATLLDEVSGSDLKVALATSSSRDWVNVVSERLGIQKWFDLMVSASDLGCRAKPAPDIYLGTAELLGISPRTCLVVEDSSPGVIAARRAGMTVIGLRNGFNDSQDFSTATSLLDGFSGATLSTLNEHFMRGAAALESGL